MQKIHVDIGGIKVSADQDRIKRELHKLLGITFDSLELDWSGSIEKKRPTVIASDVPSNLAPTLEWAFTQTFGAFSVIRITSGVAAA